MQVVYIDSLPNNKVNLGALLQEYELVKDSLADVTNHDNFTLVQRKLHLIKLNQDHILLDKLKYTKSVINDLRDKLEFNSVTYRLILPNTAYNWHTDPGSLCLHIPLITNPGCWFVYENRCFRMPADGTVYVVNNKRPHTFVNSGSEPRVHLTFEILD